MPRPIKKRSSGTENELNHYHACSKTKKKRISDEMTPRKSVKSNISGGQPHSSPSTSSSNNSAQLTQGASPKNTDKCWIEKRKIIIKEELPSPMDVNDMNVSQLLALGESNYKAGVNNYHFSDSDSGNDFEEVKNIEIKTPEIPKEGVSIIMQLPNMKRKSKMAVDAEAHIKRELNRVKKDIQLMMHKVHVLCWIAHIKFVNTVLNSPVTLKSCIALVKCKNIYPSKYSDLNYLEGVLKWFHKNIQLEKKQTNDQFTGDILKDLTYQIEKKTAYSTRDFILIFVVLLRILGLKARVVMSFQVLPLKPHSSELMSHNKSQKEDSSKVEKLQGKKNEKCISRIVKNISKDNSKKEYKETVMSNGNDSDNDNEFKKSKLKPKKSKFNNLKKTSSENLNKNIKTRSRRNCGSKDAKSSPMNLCKDNNDNNDDDDGHFLSYSLQSTEKKKSSIKSNLNNEETSIIKVKEKSDLWTEVYVEAEEKWISVDVPRNKIHCVNEIYSRATHPVLYVIACNNDSTLKDITKRYVPHWHSDTKKKRVDEEWWNETMQPYLPPKTAQDKEEDDEILQQLHDKPLPSVISEFKDHPLYALRRHLLKFEAIYPPDAPTLGFVRGEPVYARECVVTLHSREMWYKQARVVRLKEDPYKIVKARPKYDKMTGEVKKDLPLELFGIWQTEDYIPPIAVDGRVPRNEYGNVDLFKSSMLPIGTVHLQIPALNKVARKLGIDCVPATVGFDFHSGGSHPVFDGFVVCQEFKDILLDHWNKEIDESAKRNEEKKEKRVYDNWKRLIRGLLIREKLKLKYSFGKISENLENDRFVATTSTSKKLIAETK